MLRVAIIGAGAAGCFCAANVRRMAPEATVTLFEAGARPMAKLAITGGGRCNLTNDFAGIRSLSEAYPRGERVMKRALKVFSQDNTIEWFHAAGVPCVLQPDHCWFPRSQDAMDVVRCLQKGMEGATLRLSSPVTSLSAIMLEYDCVVVTTGGFSKGSSSSFLDGLELEIVPPLPSLFTLNIPDKRLTSLMGLVVGASVSLQGSAFRASGPLLITDWGISGPATLKLSSYAARHLADTGYKGTVLINWMDAPESNVRELLRSSAERNPQKQVANTPLLPQRLWLHLVEKGGLREDIRWAELGTKGMNRLVATLVADAYPISGKGRFREEFVTAGGVALSNIDLNTLEAKRYPGLFFAGEVLDIDAITGGFNLQAAWSTGYVCARQIALRAK